MAGSKIIQSVASRASLSARQADFLEQVILAVRKDCERPNSSGVESVINKILDEYVESGALK